MNIVYTILMLCVLILVHEFGHFIVAKINGIYVEEFALGMGPTIIQWGKNETKYSLRLFPIGGYVKMLGEDAESNEPRAFCNKGVLARMAVVVSGPVMNFIIAIVFFMVAFMYFGVPATTPIIGAVAENSPAYEAGIVKDDIILTIDGVAINNWQDLSQEISSQVGEELTIEYQRDGEVKSSIITPVLDSTGSKGIIGINQGLEKANLLMSIKMGFVKTYEFTKLMILSIVQMITGELEAEFAGPVGIVGIVGDYANIGLMYLFLLAGILSINLGIMNLLPLPALDGSRLVFLAIEGIRKKPVAAEKEAMIHFVGIIVLFGFMIFITYKDIMKLF